MNNYKQPLSTELTRGPRNGFTISFSSWKHQPNLAGSKVVLEEPCVRNLVNFRFLRTFSKYAISNSFSIYFLFLFLLNIRGIWRVFFDPRMKRCVFTNFDIKLIFARGWDVRSLSRVGSALQYRRDLVKTLRVDIPFSLVCWSNSDPQ